MVKVFIFTLIAAALVQSQTFAAEYFGFSCEPRGYSLGNSNPEFFIHTEEVKNVAYVRIINNHHPANRRMSLGLTYIATVEREAGKLIYRFRDPLVDKEREAFELIVTWDESQEAEWRAYNGNFFFNFYSRAGLEGEWTFVKSDVQCTKSKQVRP